MNWFNNLKLKYKFGIVLILFAVGLALFAINSFQTIKVLEINGDMYKEIVNGKDLIADILPPPDYIVESHLVCFQMLNEYDQATLNELFAKAKQQSEEFETRQKFWRTELKNGQLKDDMVTNSYKPAVEYYNIRDSKFIPLIKSGKRKEAQELLLNYNER